ncbi:HAMP domain-containing protein [Pseudomonas muyukensis]|uniref:histidine kinase n=2 Tax=Pseudomonas muyukensis TaxID=2842357 RepID=A0ABX8MHG8_9PSED|nr:HAMP domain-containing protein [Pseudomonas muyukensis]
MTLLAVGAVITITVCMYLYFWVSDYQVLQTMTAEDQAALAAGMADVAHHEPRLWQLLQTYYDIREFLPGPGDLTDWLVLYGFLIAIIPVTLIVGLYLSRPLSRQFHQITEAARRVAEGDLTPRVSQHPRQPKEMQRLCSDFNKLVERLALYENEVAESSSNLAHELRTPLNAALGRVQGMLDEVFALCPEQLRLVQGQLYNLNTLVGDLHLLSLAHAGQLPLHLSLFAPAPLVEERLAWFAPQFEAAGMQVRASLDEPLAIEADRARLGQLINILIENAIKYASDGRELSVAVRQADGALHLEFLDRGQAVEHKDLGNMFVRFWRAEQSRARVSGGGGLGLSIAQAICEAHGGRISAQRRAEGGLAVRVSLPLRSE